MAIGYTKKTWANGAPPALSAANLQALDDAVEAACDAVDVITPKYWYSSSGTGGSDGNGGQPPAPKPTNQGTVGNWGYVSSRTTPNVSGAVYAIICFDTYANFVGALASVAANTDVAGAGAPFTNTTQMMYWRTA